MPRTAETARWLEALARDSREAQAAAGSGNRGSMPRAEGVERSIQVLHRGIRHRRTLRLLLDHAASLLTWQHVENGWVRQSGQVSMLEAQPDETIRKLIGDFVEWSADVASR